MFVCMLARTTCCDGRHRHSECQVPHVMKGSLTSGLSDSGKSMRAVENDVEAMRTLFD